MATSLVAPIVPLPSLLPQHALDLEAACTSADNGLGPLSAPGGSCVTFSLQLARPP